MNKFAPTGQDVEEIFENIPSVKKQADAYSLVDVYATISGEIPVVWYPGIIGFGETKYRLDSGRTGLTPRLAFAPRQTKFCLYFDTSFLEEQVSLLQSLGKYKTGKGCVYINKLADIDLDVLQELLKQSL
ncbi:MULTISPECIES: DUF1801 domain-containing protein [unclassified Streptococcus]|uniref:DUF1801 domain-containing protein n=1 Tax=unclassified Streptococcus TaxID=2608887 RepID=UPI001072E902|nr:MULTISPECIES: DUF1801 domain-containing protein [unclassified Streptococcus]MBF0806083.1 DUF1801 domain-containing protein [Streptococcus sp. 19428wA2_WM07]TFU28330.1 DUF1801 domain-containing protein [Streptococcus sp. WM07]